jgi:hypothetical protein
MLHLFVREAHFSTCSFVFQDNWLIFGAALRAALVYVNTAAMGGGSSIVLLVFRLVTQNISVRSVEKGLGREVELSLWTATFI